MRSSIYRLLMLALLGYPMGVFSQASFRTDLTQPLKSHFANLYGVKSDAVHLDIIHAPKSHFSEPFTILSQHGKKLGHQTLWLVGDNSNKKMAITLKVSVDMPVLTAMRKISRRSELNQANVKSMIKRINWNADQYVTSFEELDGMMAVQVLRAGDGITKNMIRSKPDMNRGDDVTVKIVSGNLIVETNGTAKKDGVIGDNVFVILSKTGKRISGEVISKNIVKVELN